MNTIQKELKRAEEKKFEEEIFGEETIVKLTPNNVAIVEAMLCYDSAYNRSVLVDAKPRYSNNKLIYGGSTAYWMTVLKEILVDGVENKIYSYESIIENAVAAIDRENNTHLNADKCGRAEIKQRICEFDRVELIKCLKNPNYKDLKLIEELSRKTSALRRARNNLSFASKFCHYACYYFFPETDNQDNYPIYDSVIKKVLPIYLKRYNINYTYKLDNYKYYCDAIERIRKASDIEISRNGLDHLLWYYYKGRYELV